MLGTSPTTRARTLIRVLPLLLGVGLATPAPAQSATLTVSPAVVPGGSAFAAGGAGFGSRGRVSVRIGRAASTGVRADAKGSFAVTLAAPRRAGRVGVRARARGRAAAGAPLSVVARRAPALSGSVGWSGGRRLTIYSVSATRLRVVGAGFSGRDRRISIRTRGSRAVTLRVRSRGRAAGSLRGSLRLRARRGSEPSLVVISRRSRVRLRLRGPGSASLPGGGRLGGPKPVAAPLLVAAGDIACAPGASDACQQAATAQLVQSLNPAAVAALGDLQYEEGSMADFRASFEPTWGRFKGMIRPIPGNHEYRTSGAGGYFEYFGAAAGAPGRGYYSYDLGAWHVIALNSNDDCSVVSCSAGSPQEQWLRADLAANPRACVLAYVHAPRFSSGREHGDSTSVRDLWRALHEAGADVVLAAHDHGYERFAPQDPDGLSDPARGLRSFVVGTGGKEIEPFGKPRPNSEVRDYSSFGVLALTLRPSGYDWRFVPVPGAGFTDAGSGACH